MRHTLSRAYAASLTSLARVCSPLVMKVRSRASSIMSGASTPGGGRMNSLSEGDLRKADAALSHVHEVQKVVSVNGVAPNGVNGNANGAGKH